jgi:hypothetical protein
MAFVNFPAVVQKLLQQNFLAREMQEGLDSVLAYRRVAIQETFPGRIGETLTRTRKGRKKPVTDAISITSLANLDNGLSPTANPWSIEQYVTTIEEYADTSDLNLMQEQAGIADQFIANARNNGVQAAQSLERICRKKLFGAYLSGNTRITAAPDTAIIDTPQSTLTTLASGASGNINVDDIRGFTTAIVNGYPTAVSVSTPLSAVVIQATGTTFSVSVEAATAYGYEANKSALDITNTPDAIPGKLTIKNNEAGTYTYVANDVLIATDAPAIFRNRGVRGTHLITSSDVISFGIIEDAVAYLRDNGIPPMADGTYHCILDNTSLRQLFADQDFKQFYAGRAQDAEIRNQDIIQLAGVSFITTTESYIQPSTGAATNKPAVKVRRPIVCGAESIIQANFDGMITWLGERGLDRNDSPIAMVDGVVQIVREPLDRLQQIVAMSWTWIGDFAVPTDVTATATIIPTASNARYKRCVVIEHAG